MSRYIGPTNKKSRRYQYSLLENNKEYLKGKRRISPPGEHPVKKGKLSNYGEHLYEKQKLKFMYGIGERQLRNKFEEVSKMKGVIGMNLLVNIESRLDNIIYRAGIANTRRQSRQFVNHGIILVNGKNVDIPSYGLEVGDKFEIKDKYKNNVFIKSNLEELTAKEFVEFDKKTLKGEYKRFPKREEISGQINESLIVEFYNK